MWFDYSIRHYEETTIIKLAELIKNNLQKIAKTMQEDIIKMAADIKLRTE
jgi:hypothetical protein